MMDLLCYENGKLVAVQNVDGMSIRELAELVRFQVEDLGREIAWDISDEEIPDLFNLLRDNPFKEGTE